MSISDERLEKIPEAVAAYRKAAACLLDLCTAEDVADMAQELLKLRKAGKP